VHVNKAKTSFFIRTIKGKWVSLTSEASNSYGIAASGEMIGCKLLYESARLATTWKRFLLHKDRTLTEQQRTAQQAGIETGNQDTVIPI